jgi:O-methyltransferase involved in polyketide biosynthesis
MLTTLYSKALDASWNRPVLGDAFAKEVVSRIDYDWQHLKVADRWTPLVTVRAAQFDIWTSQFLSVHPRSTVVHLGCGLDSRYFRLDPGPDVVWYDVDQPAVIELREQLFPTRPGYHLIATSATDTVWLDELPADRPALLLAEGISMYLTEPDGVALLQRFVDRFPSGELQIDFYNWLAVRSQRTHRLQRSSGSTLHWAVDRPDEILDRIAGIRLLADATFFDASTFSRVPDRLRRNSAPLRAIRPLRNMFQYHRYAFGPVS